VIAFLGAADKWGLLLTKIDVRPRQLTCIATFARKIVAACDDIVYIYDAVTFVLRQSLRIPETATKIQGSPDESTLFVAHSYSITMWDVQTGGLTHTFTTQSEISDIAVSTTGDRIACGSSDGSITFWNTRTKQEGECFGNVEPVVAIFWLSPRKLAVATQGTVFTHDIGVGETSSYFFAPGRVWGMVCASLGGSEFLVGTSRSGKGTGRNSSFLGITTSKQGRASEPWEPNLLFTRTPPRAGEELSSLVLADKVIACITPPKGVRSFDTESWDSMGDPPVLDAATSVAVSLNRNIVAQTEDSIQIFSLDALTSGEARNDARVSHVYPLGAKHIICLLQPNRHLTILELRTLRELSTHRAPTPRREHSRWGGDLPPGLLPADPPPSVGALLCHGFVAELGVQAVMQAWRSDSPLPEWTEAADEDVRLSALSPDSIWVVTFYSSPRRELRAKRIDDGTVIANLALGDEDLEMGKVYDVAFDSQSRFHLKIDKPGWTIQIPYDMTPSAEGRYLYTITKAGEPVALPEPREIPPYTLDANCEWVVDAESRKICWISGNVRRGGGGHFWVGLSLVMVGDDGVVRKVTFVKPEQWAKRT
jgi:WD40 repeat protein